MNFEWPKSEGALIKNVIALGTKNSKTLGHFPAGAFKEQAKKRHILCAVGESGELMGYLLFGITQSKMRLRITHLCVASEHRGKGIAKGLLSEIKDKYQFQLKSMGLSCRKDYKRASEFWRSFGFKPYAEVRSRSREENYLVKWLYEFGNLDLFSFTDTESTAIQALLDANVIIKMREVSEKDSTQEDPLLADWLIDEVDYYFAPELMTEIHRDPDSDRVERTRVFCTRFKEAKFRPDKRDVIAENLKAYLNGTSLNDTSDRVQLSECIASEIDYFITSDANILSVEEQVYKEYGVQITSPADFVLMIDEIQNRTDYQASRLAGVNFEYRQIRPGEIDAAIQEMLSNDKREKKHEFKQVLNSIVIAKGVGNVKVLKNGENDFLGIYTEKLSIKSILVERIRTSKSKLSTVLFIQLVFNILNEARSKAIEIIEISDPYLLAQQEILLQSFGFVKKESRWVKIALYGIMEAKQAIARSGSIEKAYNKEKLINNLERDKSNDFASQLERKLWPVKFTDIDIPTYLIPIKPYWAGELFDYYSSEQLLFGAKPHLAWNRENVYYRSVNPVSEKSPGRILWYVSSTASRSKQRTSAIVATSYVDDVVVGSAKSLFSAFKAYGVYEWKNILEQAKGDPYGIVKAIKFSDTEVFAKPITYQHVNDILQSNGRAKNTFASPLFVSKEIFKEIYLRGTQLKA